MSTGTAVPTHDRWDVWGTYAFLAVAEVDLLQAARRVADAVLADVDRACSRFREDSWLSRVNRRPGRWVSVDPLLATAVAVAVGAAELTDGLVDPCLGRTIVSLGYDRDLAELVERPAATGSSPAPPPPGAWREVQVSEDAVRIPEGVALDLGATAKAWAADLVAQAVVDALDCPVVVSLGGDVRVLGPDPDQPASWPVVVGERPGQLDGAVPVHVTGGLATSSTLVRRWAAAGGEHHHLLDPRTGQPVPEVLRTATAAGTTCVAANTASTAALVLGSDAPTWLRDRGVTARLVAADGSVTTVGSWPTPVEEVL